MINKYVIFGNDKVESGYLRLNLTSGTTKSNPTIVVNCLLCSYKLILIYQLDFILFCFGGYVYTPIVKQTIVILL